MDNSDPLIQLSSVKKKYCKNLRKAMWYGVKDVFGNRSASSVKSSEILREQEFWAVNGVSFQLNRGECLGIVGPNGAGKSSLLRLINGLLLPDDGVVNTNGKIGSLLGIGAGFHPMLTGRENIYVNASALGIYKKEIDRIFDDIVDFAQLRDFIDSPVKYYSSGMYMRLGFSIAIQTKPDILLIDEVLAVGDIAFWVKSFNAITEMLNESAVIFVSHSMAQISRICTSIMVLEHGEVKYHGNDVPKGIEYYNMYAGNDSSVNSITTDEASIHSMDLISGDDSNIGNLSYGSKFSVRFIASIDTSIRKPTANIVFIAQDGRIIAQASSIFNKAEIHNENGRVEIKADFDTACFNPGPYTVVVAVMDEGFNKIIARREERGKLVVKGDFYGGAPVQLQPKWASHPVA